MTADDEIIETTAVVVAEPSPPPASLFGTNDPALVIEKATAVADALKSVINRQGLISRISGREYVLTEGWTLLGSMLGVFPVNIWTRPIDGPVEGGKHKNFGWEARVEARTRDGVTVGGAEAQCTRSENTWKGRDDYALRSMAQTRATSKALRMPLGFVVTLAGFEATPADEMAYDAPPQGTFNGNRPVEIATDKQVFLIKKLLREEVPPDELEAFLVTLQLSYPTAFNDDGKLVVARLTKHQAGEVITILKEGAAERTVHPDELGDHDQ